MNKPTGIEPVLWIGFGLIAGVVIGALVGHVGWGVAFGIIAGGALMAIFSSMRSGDKDQ